MKRHRVLRLSFDFTARLLDPEFTAGWDEEARQQWQAQADRIKQELADQYGDQNIEQKLQNLQDIGAQSMSVIDTHNIYYRQVRHAFIVGAYYPALTATAALGERILNDLILKLRQYYPVPKDFPEVRTHKTFSNWRQMIDALEEWGVLLPNVVTSFRALSRIRGRSIHYNPITQFDMRQLAVEAIQHMNTIIEQQFGILGCQPWYIPGIRGQSFIGKDWETNPFVREFLLPHAVLVGPEHRLTHDEVTGLWDVEDIEYDDREVTDKEFRLLVDPDGVEP